MNFCTSRARLPHDSTPVNALPLRPPAPKEASDGVAVAIRLGILVAKKCMADASDLSSPDLPGTIAVRGRPTDLYAFDILAGSLRAGTGTTSS